MNARRPDHEIGADLIRLGMEMQQPVTYLANAVLRVLASGGSASGTDLARILRRRQADVFRACTQLSAEGRIRRVGQRWEAA